MPKPTTAIVAACFAASIGQGQVPQDPLVLRPVRYDLDVRVDFTTEQIEGTARIQLRNENRKSVSEASFILYRLMSVRDVRDARGSQREFQQSVVAFEDFEKLQGNHVRVPLAPALAPGQETTIVLRYGGHLLGYAETGMEYVKDRVDSAYTLLREDANAYPTIGYPSLGARRRAGLPTYEYTARITVPATHTVANGGELVSRTSEGATTAFVYRSVKPSWRMDFAIAPFRTLRRGTLTVFHLPEDSSGAQRILGAMTETMALYVRWFGPLNGEPPFTVIEIPDGWGSQADVTSILQAAAAFRDPKREYELYHELSHLWNVPSADKPSPRWNEGLATFLEDVTTDSLRGRATTDSSALHLATWLAGRLRSDSGLRGVPAADYGKREMTGYAYTVGSLMFYALYRVLGHGTFTRLIGDYYRAHGTNAGSTDDFVRMAQSLSALDLTILFDDWFYSTRWSEIVRGAKSPQDLYKKYESGSDSN